MNWSQGLSKWPTSWRPAPLGARTALERRLKDRATPRSTTRSGSADARRCVDSRHFRRGRERLDPGLCRTCRYARIVRNRRGSEFWLCQAAADDPRMPRYPPLPVLQCNVRIPDTPEGVAEHEVKQKPEPDQEQAAEERHP